MSVLNPYEIEEIKVHEESLEHKNCEQSDSSKLEIQSKSASTETEALTLPVDSEISLQNLINKSVKSSVSLTEDCVNFTFSFPKSYFSRLSFSILEEIKKREIMAIESSISSVQNDCQKSLSNVISNSEVSHSPTKDPNSDETLKYNGSDGCKTREFSKEKVISSNKTECLESEDECKEKNEANENCKFSRVKTLVSAPKSLNKFDVNVNYKQNTLEYTIDQNSDSSMNTDLVEKEEMSKERETSGKDSQNAQSNLKRNNILCNSSGEPSVSICDKSERTTETTESLLITASGIERKVFLPSNCKPKKVEDLNKISYEISNIDEESEKSSLKDAETKIANSSPVHLDLKSSQIASQLDDGDKFMESCASDCGIKVLPVKENTVSAKISNSCSENTIDHHDKLDADKNTLNKISNESLNIASALDDLSENNIIKSNCQQFTTKYLSESTQGNLELLPEDTHVFTDDQESVCEDSSLEISSKLEKDKIRESQITWKNIFPLQEIERVHTEEIKFETSLDRTAKYFQFTILNEKVVVKVIAKKNEDISIEVVKFKSNFASSDISSNHKISDKMEKIPLHSEKLNVMKHFNEKCSVQFEYSDRIMSDFPEVDIDMNTSKQSLTAENTISKEIINSITDPVKFSSVDIVPKTLRKSVQAQVNQSVSNQIHNGDKEIAGKHTEAECLKTGTAAASTETGAAGESPVVESTEAVASEESSKAKCSETDADESPEAECSEAVAAKFPVVECSEAVVAAESLEIECSESVAAEESPEAECSESVAAEESPEAECSESVAAEESPEAEYLESVAVVESLEPESAETSVSEESSDAKRSEQKTELPELDTEKRFSKFIHLTETENSRNLSQVTAKPSSDIYRARLERSLDCEFKTPQKDPDNKFENVTGPLQARSESKTTEHSSEAESNSVAVKEFLENKSAPAIVDVPSKLENILERKYPDVVEEMTESKNVVFSDTESAVMEKDISSKALKLSDFSESMKDKVSGASVIAQTDFSKDELDTVKVLDFADSGQKFQTKSETSKVNKSFSNSNKAIGEDLKTTNDFPSGICLASETPNYPESQTSDADSEQNSSTLLYSPNLSKSNDYEDSEEESYELYKVCNPLETQLKEKDILEVKQNYSDKSGHDLKQKLQKIQNFEDEYLKQEENEASFLSVHSGTSSKDTSPLKHEINWDTDDSLSNTSEKSSQSKVESESANSGYELELKTDIKKRTAVLKKGKISEKKEDEKVAHKRISKESKIGKIKSKEIATIHSDEVDAAPTRLRIKHYPATSLAKDAIPEDGQVTQGKKLYGFGKNKNQNNSDSLTNTSLVKRSLRARSEEPTLKQLQNAKIDISSRRYSADAGKASESFEQGEISSTRRKRAQTPDLIFKEHVDVTSRSTPRKVTRSTALNLSQSTGNEESCTTPKKLRVRATNQNVSESKSKDGSNLNSSASTSRSNSKSNTSTTRRKKN